MNKLMIAVMSMVLFQACSAAPEPEPPELPAGQVAQALQHLTLTPSGPVDYNGPGGIFVPVPSLTQACTSLNGCAMPSPGNWAPYILWNNPSQSADLNNWIGSNGAVGVYMLWSWGNFFKGDGRCRFRNLDTQFILSVEDVLIQFRVSTGSHEEPFYIYTLDAQNRPGLWFVGTLQPNLTDVGLSVFLTQDPYQGGAPQTPNAPLTPQNMGCGASQPPRFGYFALGYGLKVKSFNVVRVDYTVTP